MAKLYHLRAGSFKGGVNPIDRGTPILYNLTRRNPMDECEPLLSALPGTALAAGIREVLSIYRDADRDTAEFSRNLPSGCPPGCGTCCEGFNPDLLGEEANLIALYLVYLRRELIPLLYEKTGSCPMYTPDSSFHCRVYPVRPLVCRAFGFTASLDKKERAVFRLCARMPDWGKREYTAEELSASGYGDPPLFTEYGLRLSSLSASAERACFSDAVLAATFKVYQLKALSGSDDDPENDNPNDRNPPAGNAA